MQADIKTKNGKKLKVKALVDSGCTHTKIDEQLVKNKKIQTKPINFSFEVFNIDGSRNGKVTKVVPLEIKINGHKETLEAAVMDLDRTDCYELKLKGLSNRTTLVLSNTRELHRVPKTK